MKRVLIVDDDKNIRRLVGVYLERQGFTCEFCINGLDAVNMAKQHEFALIIIDFHMLEMNGIDAIKAIRANEADNESMRVTIVAISSDDAVRSEMLMAGANEFFVKTDFFQILSKAISRWLG